MKSDQIVSPEQEMNIQFAVGDIKDQLVLGKGSLDDVYELLKGRHIAMLSSTPRALALQLEALKAAYLIQKDLLNQVEYMRTPKIKSLNSHNWYAGPTGSAAFWNSLVQDLHARGRNQAEIDDVDSSSSAVVSLLHPPGHPQFKHLGMVVGNVQSGKTGNIAAVIAKAAGTPYRFFLVLSGMTNILRRQTQSRLHNDLVRHHPDLWHEWTSIDTDSVETPRLGFQFDVQGKQLAILKKNAAVLRRFLKKLKATNSHILEQTAFLIIDDECDQASVNSAKARDEITVINGLIRQIISVLPRVSYVGYTATPYANVLIDPRPHTSRPLDLYPAEFIYPLRPSDAYFGPEKLFGRSLLLGEEAENDIDGLDMIRPVPDNELKSLRPAGSKPFEFLVTASLDSALRYYILCLAARAARGQADKHSTMLIHTSHLISVHTAASNAVIRHVDALRSRLLGGDKELLLELETLWEKESKRIRSEDMGCEHVPFDSLEGFLLDQSLEVEVIVDNSAAVTRIDYESPGARKYIVIGGNVLARGLTLEGLMVSFFVRSSRQYDTLMQMGRWFGYREGYEDLPRIWMEPAVQQSFRDLAMVEAEIREEMSRYERDQTTPSQFAMRIRQIPGMAITAPAKMQHAVTCDITYSGAHGQTFRFNRCNREWLEQNWSAGVSLLEAAERNGASGQRQARGYLYEAVAHEHVLRFLSRYRPHETHSNLKASLLAGFIRKCLDAGDSRYRRWNIMVVSPSNGKESSEKPLESLGTINKVIRSRLGALPGPVADIKALMSLGDATADLNADRNPLSWKEVARMRKEADAPPLLLLYPIDRVSPPKAEGGVRVPMDAVMDILGMGIVFPETRGGASQFVSVQLPAIDPDDQDEADSLDFAELFDTSADDTDE